ncbi:MAG: glycosyltransferase family 4 protein [Bacteroidota bacterium]
MRTRILYGITRAELGGAQTHVLELIRAATGFGWEVGLVTGEEGPLTVEAASLGAQTYLVRDLMPSINPYRDTLAVQGLGRVMKSFRPMLVHAHSSKAGLLCRAAAAARGIPALFTAHGWAFTDGVPLGRKCIAVASELVASRLCQRIITVSDYDLNLARRYGVPADKLIRIHNGIPDDASRAAPGQAGLVRVIMVARFAPPKRQVDLVRAALDLAGDFRLDFVGDGPSLSQSLEALKGEALKDKAVFWGARSDVPALLARSHIFVLLSDWEGLPISIIEAMRAGLPVVASDVGGVKELVSHGTTGFLIPRGDVAGLREKLQLLIEDSRLRVKLGAAGRERYTVSFTTERMVAETWRIYASVLGSRAV